MLLNPTKEERPLKDAVIETIERVSRDSIPKFIDRGLRQLNKDAERIKAVRAQRDEDEKILFAKSADGDGDDAEDEDGEIEYSDVDEGDNDIK